MRRWAGILLAGASLLLCLGTAGLWVRSYVVSDGASYVGQPTGLYAWSERGRLGLSVNSSASSRPSRSPGWQVNHWPPGVLSTVRVDPGLRWDHHLLGFAWSATRGGTTPRVLIGPGSWRTTTFWPGWTVGVPHVAVVLASGAAGVWLVRRLAVSRRRGLGQCVTCGYDLRATPGRCPECGAVPAEVAHTASVLYVGGL